MKKARSTVVLAAVALLSCLEPSMARAAPPSDAARASALFHEGAAAYRDGRFQEAVSLLLQARALKAEPVLLYDLGRAYEALGKPAEAADAYAQYLNEEPAARDRKSVQGRIEALRRQAEALEAQKREEARAKNPPPVAPPPAPPPKAETPPPRQESSNAVAALPWVVGGLGVAALGTGIAFGAFAKSGSDAARAEHGQAAASAKYDDARRDATIANVAFVAGAALVVSAGVWLLVRPRSAAAAATAHGLAFTF